MIKNLIFFLPALLFMGLSGLPGFALLYGSGDAGGVRLGKEIPEFELSRLGSTVLLSRQDLPQNRALLLNLWGSWCHSCAVEHAELMMALGGLWGPPQSVIRKIRLPG